jgi:hypothetical protein
VHFQNGTDLYDFPRQNSGRNIMTGYTVHTGSNDNFRDGWDQIFSSGKKTPAKSVSKSKTRAKKSAGKSAGKRAKKKR